MYKYTKKLVKWEDNSISLVERIINIMTDKIIMEKETDVLIYKKHSKLCYYVKAELIEEKEDRETELTI